MKAVSLDIGAGTVDFLLYEEGKLVENCIKIVLPSPQRVFGAKIRESTIGRTPIFLDGYTIGGGALTAAIKNHLSEGCEVYMTPQAAFSVRNNLAEVEHLGIHIVEDKPSNCKKVTLNETRLSSYESFLNNYNETLKDVDVCAISVKDHGAAPEGVSNRVFRIQKFREIIQKKNSLHSFLFHESQVPDYYYRMKSAIQSSKVFIPDSEVYLMDTSISALVGCLLDHRVKGNDPALVVNFGNSHTTAAITSGHKIRGFFEHHTSRVNTVKAVELLKQLCQGDLTNEQIFQDGGHGAVLIGEPPGFSSIEVIAVTGPKRSIMENSGIDYLYAAPGGDVMMTGTLGILASLKTMYS